MHNILMDSPQTPWEKRVQVVLRDGRTDGRTDKRTNGRTVERKMDERTNERTNKRTNERTEQTAGRTESATPVRVLTVLPIGLRAPLGVLVGQLSDVPVVDSGGGRSRHRVLVLFRGVTALGAWTGVSIQNK